MGESAVAEVDLDALSSGALVGPEIAARFFDVRPSTLVTWARIGIVPCVRPPGSGRGRKKMYRFLVRNLRETIEAWSTGNDPRPPRLARARR